MVLSLLASSAVGLLLSASTGSRTGTASRRTHPRMNADAEATCAWATDPYTSRETAASLSAPWVNEENGYLKKFQASASPTQGAPPKASNAAAPPPVATCAWATDPYSSRDTVAPRKAPWENEENGYLQKWQGRVVPTQPAAAPTHVR